MMRFVLSPSLAPDTRSKCAGFDSEEATDITTYKMIGVDWSPPAIDGARKNKREIEPTMFPVCEVVDEGGQRTKRRRQEQQHRANDNGESGVYSLGENPLESDSNLLSEVLAFCPLKDFLFIAGVNKAWKASWVMTGRPKNTGIRLVTATAARTEWVAGEPEFGRSAARLGGIFRLTAEAGNLGGLQASLAAHDGDWRSSSSAFVVTAVAAGAGHLDMLRWAISNGCAWCKNTCTKNAAAGGHLDVLQRLQDMGCTVDQSTCSLAAQGGHLEALKWIREQGCQWGQNTCSSAAAGGHLDVVRWARAQGCPWGRDTCRNAAKGGHLELLKWARSHGCPWDSDTCGAAARNGHLEVLKWASEQGCPWDSAICWAAMKEGDLEILKWAWEQGCPWNALMCPVAIMRGHLHVLKWARQQGCPWNKAFCEKVARSKGRQEIENWIRQQQE